MLSWNVFSRNQCKVGRELSSDGWSGSRHGVSLHQAHMDWFRNPNTWNSALDNCTALIDIIGNESNVWFS